MAEGGLFIVRVPAIASVVTGGVLAASVVMSVGSAATAAADPAASTRTVTAREAATHGREQSVLAYWTRGRMQSARPVAAPDVAAAGSPATSSTPVARGRAVQVGATRATPAAGVTPARAPVPGGYWTRGGSVAATTGKVFFTMNGSDYVCSGSATASANRDLVTTAGHCVKDGAGAWATHWVFVPGYHKGARPHGTFTARKVTTTSAWAGSGNVDYDVGMAVVNTRDGRHLTAVVGGQGIAFNLRRGLSMSAFGYPAAAPYSGGRLAYCRGTVFGDTTGGSNDQGMRCDMTGGSSGGPWLARFHKGAGAIGSVTSFAYTGLADVLWGPYFGSTVHALYRRAQSL